MLLVIVAIHLFGPSVLLLKLFVFVVDVKVIINFSKDLGGGRIEVQGKGIFQIKFSFSFQLVLQLFNLEDAFGINHFQVSFHKFIEKNIFRGESLLKEVFQIFLILLNVIARTRAGLLAL